MLDDLTQYCPLCEEAAKQRDKMKDALERFMEAYDINSCECLEKGSGECLYCVAREAMGQKEEDPEDIVEKAG